MKEIKWGEGVLRECTGKECFVHDRAWCTPSSSVYCSYIDDINIKQITFIKRVEK